MKTFLRILATLYLLVLLSIWVAVSLDTGRTWWVSLYLFSPRWALVLPGLVLFPLTLGLYARLAALYLLHGILLFVLVGFCWPLGGGAGRDPSAGRLRMITCNLGEGPIRIEQLVALVRQHDAQLLVLQESPPPLSQEIFADLGWNHQQGANIAIGSNLPMGDLRIVSRRTDDAYHYIVAVGADIRLPLGDDAESERAAPAGDKPSALFQVVGIHFPTFRPAFEKAQRFDYSGSEEFRTLAASYRGYVEQAVTGIQAKPLPTILAGDFNVPVESAFYRDYWSSFQNALSLRGLGLCSTKYTRLHGVRIDHVLTDRHWRIIDAEVGPGLGGDHRPVIVELQLSTPSGK